MKRRSGNFIWKIAILEKENQCLKNKVENRQAVIQKLIKSNKCRNKKK